MIINSKSLYQVKLVLDYLPKEEYILIPKETINYINDNFEYDENFSINPKIPLEKQKIDKDAYDFLENIVKQIQSKNLKEYLPLKNEYSEVEEYINKVKQSNNNYNTKIENIRLNNLVDFLKKENRKIPKAKELLEEYQEVLKQKEKEIEMLKRKNQDLYKYIKSIPIFIRKIFIKDIDTNY